VPLYLDVYLSVNFLLDFILLYAAGCLAQALLEPRRLIAAASVGTLYALGYVLPSVPRFMYGAGGLVATSVLMVWIAFGAGPRARGRVVMTRAVLFLYVSAVFAVGAGSSLLGLSGRGSGHGLAGRWGPINMAVCLAGATFITLLLARRLSSVLAIRSWRQNPIVALEVWVEGRSVGLTGLVDTGNHLADPLTGLPCLVAEADSLRSLVPDCLRRAAGDGGPLPVTFPVAAEGGEGWNRRLRLVPFSSLGSADGMLVGFRPDRVVIHTPRAAYEAGAALVCLTGGTLARSGEYNALIPTRLTLQMHRKVNDICRAG